MNHKDIPEELLGKEKDEIIVELYKKLQELEGVLAMQDVTQEVIWRMFIHMGWPAAEIAKINGEVLREREAEERAHATKEAGLHNPPN